MEQDKELQAVFERTYGKVNRGLAFQPQKKPARTSLDEGKYTIKSQRTGPEYLLVDGYNIIFAWDELKDLYDNGLLFTKDDYIDPEAAALMQQDAPIKALCLHVSHDCNLRCRYCFASTGDFGTGKRMTMSFETAKRAIDFVIEKSGQRRNLEVDFFGGEPLMAMDTVKKTVEYARSIEKEHSKNFRFTITTNGVLLDDETIDYINRGDVQRGPLSGRTARGERLYAPHSEPEGEL